MAPQQIKNMNLFSKLFSRLFGKKTNDEKNMGMIISSIYNGSFKSDDIIKLLGEPKAIKYSKTEDGLYCKDMIWLVNGSEIVTKIISKNRFEEEEIEYDINYELMLAIKNEDFELAAELRDEIKNKT